MITERRYLPAASRDFLLPLYDPLMSLLGFRQALLPLVEQAALQPDHRVLDVGCGTGTLAIFVKQRFPSIDIVGADPDPKALARANRKAARANVAVRFDRAFGDALSYADATFDRVFSSMMLHHVPRAEKTTLLAEVRRVLKPGGRLELLDFAGGTHSLLAHVLHGRRASEAMDARLLRGFADAGFVEGRRVATRQTLVGTIGYYQATAPVR
jgi:ubiquinone/menaquinone biosynthesis C-methylase UbiE